METNFFSNPLVIIVIAILLLPLMLKVLAQVIPLMQERIAATFPILSDWMRRTFHWGGQLVTDEGELSPARAVAQSTGAVAMIAFAVAYTVCELQFTWATLCPMFGGVCTGEAFAGYDRLLAFSAILLAIEFGLITADLLGVTYTTHFARMQRARLFFLGVAVLCCVLSITVGGVMAWYRDLVLGMGQPDVAVADTTASLQGLQTIILISLAVLLFIGALFAFLSFDTFCSAVFAGLAVVGGLVLGLVYLLLSVLDLVAAVVLVFVKTIRDSLPAFTEKFHRRVERAKTSRSTAMTKLRGLVAPRTNAKVVKERQGSTPSPTPAQEAKENMLSVDKSSTEHLSNGYDAHA